MMRGTTCLLMKEDDIINDPNTGDQGPLTCRLHQQKPLPPITTQLMYFIVLYLYSATY